MRAVTSYGIKLSLGDVLLISIAGDNEVIAAAPSKAQVAEELSESPARSCRACSVLHVVPLGCTKYIAACNWTIHSMP